MDGKVLKWIIYGIILLVIFLIYIRLIPHFGSKFYRNIQVIKNPDDLRVLVNKNRRLKKEFIPTPLIKLDTAYSFEHKLLRKEAALALKNLIKDATKKGFHIVVVSAYRSYDYQENLYFHYVEKKGLKYADACSARPGHSEHQTGLAIDVMGSNKDYNLFEEAQEFAWMKNHAHQYGFILRYPKGKEYITGFKYEPWHYRYVGKAIAKKIFLEQLTLEEYHQKYND